ncbi:E3 ubiquitin-protein ligase TRIM45-like [Saccostrea cucullata]|uniref:E3 ubiquitin-protein ligase TRIM45-like n=1 Tax=Saccostrea cuccullata TaxID=36930 RepID=UPI002ED2EF96
MGTLNASVYQVQMNAKRPKSQRTISDWESKCELCRTPATVEWKCLNCSDFMCANCYKIHKHGKLTKMHTVISKTNRGSESNLLHNIRCDKHLDENVDIFCAKCDKPICKICLIAEHNSHSLTQMETKAEEESAKIRKLLSEVSATKIKHFQEQITNQEAAIETFSQKDKIATRDIETKTEKMIGIIREIGNKLIKENVNRLESMKNHKSSLAKELAQIRKTVEEAEISLQRGNALEIIQKSHYFERKLDQKVPDVLHPVYHDFSKFRIDKEILTALKKECNVRLHERDLAELLEKNKALQQELDKVTLENEKQMKSLQSKLNAVTIRKR